MDIKSEALSYIRDRYVEEQSRFNHFEEKCGKLVSLLTIVIGIFVSLVGFKSKALFSLDSELDWIVLGLCALLSIVLASAWGHALRALKLGDCPVAAKSRKNADYILSTSSESAFQHIVDCYVDTTEILGKVIDEKAQNLEHAYGEITASAWISALLALFIAIKELSA